MPLSRHKSIHTLQDTSLYTVAVLIAALIVIGLAATAVYYLWQLKLQTQRQQQEYAKAQAEWRKKKQSLASDIKFIAQAMVEQQCEITEGCLRIKVLMDHLDPNLQHKKEFSTIQQMHSLTSNMATHEAYKALPRKEQFKQDKERFRLEELHRDAVLKEAKIIVSYQFEILALH